MIMDYIQQQLIYYILQDKLEYGLQLKETIKVRRRITAFEKVRGGKDTWGVSSGEGGRDRAREKGQGKENMFLGGGHI